MHRLLHMCCTVFLSVLVCMSVDAATQDSSRVQPIKPTETVAALNARPIDARDLKTLHYLENAHGQLEEWTGRLLSRLENGQGPRDKEPVLDGRADLQVQKIAVTYASYTTNDALSHVLKSLAQAHRIRLTALQTMVKTGADRNQIEELSAPVKELISELRTWSKKR